MTQWYVLKTKPKKEKEVQNYLLKRTLFPVFLPLIKTGGIGTKPLFPSYLFLKTDFEDPQIHQMIRFTRGVHNILGDGEGPRPIAEMIVETLMERTTDGSLLEQELLFKEGDEITVKKGILKDLRGIVEKNLSDAGRVAVLFQWMNSSLRAVLKYTELEKAA